MALRLTLNDLTLECQAISKNWRILNEKNEWVELKGTFWRRTGNHRVDSNLKFNVDHDACARFPWNPRESGQFLR